MQIIEIKKPQIREAADVLAMAFRHDPIFNYIFETPEQYNRKAGWLFSTWVRWAVMFGKAWMTEDGSGVVLMRGLSHPEMSLWSMIRAGMLTIPFKLGIGEFRRFYFDIVVSLDRKHKAIMGNTPHWYGWMIGVKEEKKGVGKQLMQHCFHTADQVQLPIFLETSTDRNVALYQFMDFEIRDRLYLAGGGFTLFFMVRNPQMLNNTK